MLINPYRFVIAWPVGHTKIVNNSDPECSFVGEWTLWTNQGFQGDVHESFPGTGADVATWMFNNVTVGLYRVSATWFPFTNRASNSPFTIQDGSSVLATIPVNQQVNPQGFLLGGAYWDVLGNFEIFSGTLLVKLSDNANGNLNADAIHVERIS